MADISFMRRLEQRFGKFAYLLPSLFGVSIIGTLATIVIAAPIAPIPIIGMLVALPLLPFPTLVIYSGAMTLAYFLIHLLLPGKWRSGLAWTATFVAAAAIAFGAPQIANREFEAKMAKLDARNDDWQPASIDRAGSVALVRSPDTEIRDGCNSFCLSLLLSRRADSVVVVTLPERIPLAHMVITGPRYRLRADADKCLASMPPMNSPHLRLPTEQPMRAARIRKDFQLGILNEEFKAAISKCLSIDTVTDAAAPDIALVNWSSKFDEGAYDRPEPSLGAWIAITDRRAGKQQTIELTDIDGARVHSPLYIWPYGGDSGSGGTFEPVIARSHLAWNGPDLSLERWWGFVSDGDAMADAAVVRLRVE